MRIVLELNDDGPNAISVKDCHKGLSDPWYLVKCEEDGGVHLQANPEGFEYLGRYFLKMSRCHKVEGFHQHFPL
jgi:hypothetical protein